MPRAPGNNCQLEVELEVLGGMTTRYDNKSTNSLLILSVLMCLGVCSQVDPDKSLYLA